MGGEGDGRGRGMGMGGGWEGEGRGRGRGGEKGIGERREHTGCRNRSVCNRELRGQKKNLNSVKRYIRLKWRIFRTFANHSVHEYRFLLSVSPHPSHRLLIGCWVPVRLHRIEMRIKMRIICTLI